MKKLCSNCRFHNSPSAELAICGECLNSGERNRWKKKKSDIKGYIGVALVIASIIFTTWLFTCSVVSMFCLGAGVEFSWGLGTGVYLLLVVLFVFLNFSDL